MIKLEERFLRIVYNDYDLSFSEILVMFNKSAIQLKNIKALMSKIYKFLNDLSPTIMNNIFQKQENYYSLKNPRLLVSKRKFATTYGIDTISFRRPQV